MSIPVGNTSSITEAQHLVWEVKQKLRSGATQSSEGKKQKQLYQANMSPCHWPLAH